MPVVSWNCSGVDPDLAQSLPTIVVTSSMKTKTLQRAINIGAAESRQERIVALSANCIGLLPRQFSFIGPETTVDIVVTFTDDIASYLRHQN